MNDLRHEDDELLEALGVDVPVIESGGYTPREERIIAGFQDILRFRETQGRVPRHGEECDIFERLYALRLDALRRLPEARNLLAAIDTYRLLDSSDVVVSTEMDELDDEELLAELEAGKVVLKEGENIAELRHVRAPEDRRIAEDVANRFPCSDFEAYKSLFEDVENDLKTGVRKTFPFRVESETRVDVGDFFILGGQIVYVAEKGPVLELSKGKKDARLRVIYSNGTESNLLLRSLERALYKDEVSRRIEKTDMGPLFGGSWDSDDVGSGTIYVLRSKAEHPFIQEHRELVHKIGVTSDKVEARIGNAVHESTYLLSEVEVVATYKLSRINRSKLEGLLHRFFAVAQIDMTIEDRFGYSVGPKEWYLVPLQAIDEAVERIRDGSITDYMYDVKAACLVKR